MSAGEPPGDAARIAIVSDEVSADFEETLAVCLPLGIRAYEIRSLAGGRAPDCDPAAVEQVDQLVRRHALTLVGISPGFFKGACDEPRARHELDEGFDRAFALLDRLAVRRMTVFTFRRADPQALAPPQALDLLRLGADKCRRAGVEMLIENVPSCWGNSGAHLAEIAHAVGVGLTWDPGNSEASGQAAYPDGYAAVRDQVRHVHLKNWTPDGGYTAILDGQADLAGQVAALRRDHYPGYYCLEPHQWATGAQAARLNHAQLVTLLAEVNP
ncbi:MAG: sugar phosphate isomerase/epimerase [Anaerolineae bacterium]|nr:sugar phosphate isomerase/epimerase [Anaerolineae bacterium]